MQGFLFRDDAILLMQKLLPRAPGNLIDNTQLKLNANSYDEEL